MFESLKKTLDRNGSRFVLEAAATCYSRLSGLPSARVWFDRWWIRSDGQRHVVDGRAFGYYANVLRDWQKYFRRLFDRTRDYYMHGYTPAAGDTVIDVGAGIGTDAIVFSEEVGDGGGHVYAFEAHPETFERLQRMVSLHRASNITAVAAAVSDQAGKLKMVSCENDEESHLSTGQDDVSGMVEVDAVTLDGFVQEKGLQRIAFLKMNIEGAEVAALRGAAKTLAMTQCICVCCHDFLVERGGGPHLRTADTVMEQLRRAGFEVSRRSDDLRPHVKDHVWGWRRDHGSCATGERGTAS